MIEPSSVLMPGCLGKAARLLVDVYGSQAALMATECARDMRAVGREDVAREWDQVRLQTLTILTANVTKNTRLLH